MPLPLVEIFRKKGTMAEERRRRNVFCKMTKALRKSVKSRVPPARPHVPVFTPMYLLSLWNLWTVRASFPREGIRQKQGRKKNMLRKGTSFFLGEKSDRWKYFFLFVTAFSSSSSSSSSSLLQSLCTSRVSQASVFWIICAQASVFFLFF